LKAVGGVERCERWLKAVGGDWRRLEPARDNLRQLKVVEGRWSCCELVGDSRRLLEQRTMIRTGP
jgi:hypothetical protein